MKRFKSSCLLPVFILLFYTISTRAQKLKIGDNLADIKFGNVLNYPGFPQKISDFKGKALLLDFWATWCVPCVASMPKLDSLNREFSDKLQIVLASDEKASVISKYFSDNKSKLPIVAEDKTFALLFPHKGIPHYVWINQDGVITAITGSKEVTKDNITHFLNEEMISLPVKDADAVEYDNTKPLILGNQVKLSNELLYQSIITKHIKNAPGGTRWGKYYINCTNHTIRLLFELALGQFDIKFINDKYRFILEGFKTDKDSLSIGYYKKSQSGLRKELAEYNTYNYEIILDSSFSPLAKFEFMKQDLDRFFGLMGIQAKREKRMIHFFVLTKSSPEDKIMSKGGMAGVKENDSLLIIQNSSLSAFIKKLNDNFSNNNISTPVIDETGYKNRVDLTVISTLKSPDLNVLNKNLERYDLKLIEKDIETDVIVVSKKQ